MKELSLTPYSIIKGQQYLEGAKLVIRKKDFINVKYIEGTIVYSFSNCDFKNLIIENFEEIYFNDISFHFSGCYIENISVQNVLSKNISISFFSSLVSGNIKDCQVNYISFNNCILLQSFFLQNLNRIHISFTEENIFPIMWKALFKRNGIRSLNSRLKEKQSYYIYNCIEVNVSSNEKDNSKSGCYRRSNTSSDETKIGYKLTKQQKENLNLNLSINYNAQKQHTETKIADIVLNTLTIGGSPNGKVVIENAKIGEWYLADFLPKGEASFYNISPPSKLKSKSKIEFHKSNLDNTWFDGTNFNEYSLVSFYRTKFSKTTFTSCTFPRNSISFERFTSLENIHYPEKKRDSYYKDQYEVYLQLKIALEATGNFHEAHKLFAISNDALKKIKEVPKWDKLILWVNKNSNNHGLSIKKPLFLFIVFSVLLYILYLLSLGRIFNSNDIDYRLIGYYFSFIDLTHRNDFLVEKTEFNLSSLFIDYFNKVVVGYFIYQFISAFRKYGKK